MKIIDKYARGQHVPNLATLRRSYVTICNREPAAAGLYVGVAGGMDQKSALKSQAKPFARCGMTPTTVYILAQSGSRVDSLDLGRGLGRYISKDNVTRLRNDVRRLERDLAKYSDSGPLYFTYLAVESPE